MKCIKCAILSVQSIVCLQKYKEMAYSFYMDGCTHKPETEIAIGFSSGYFLNLFFLKKTKQKKAISAYPSLPPVT